MFFRRARRWRVFPLYGGGEIAAKLIALQRKSNTLREEEEEGEEEVQFYADRNETSSCVVSQEFPSQTVDARARARVFARLVSKYHMALHARWSFMRS